MNYNDAISSLEREGGLEGGRSRGGREGELEAWKQGEGDKGREGYI